MRIARTQTEKLSGGIDFRMRLVLHVETESDQVVNRTFAIHFPGLSRRETIRATSPCRLRVRP